MNDLQRFWSKVDRAGECWLWTAATVNSGYGVFQRSRTGLVGARQVTAHRFSCEAAHGPIPPGMEVCHTCDNKLCVRPDHLYVGTRQQNARDAVDRGLYRCATRKLTEAQVYEIRASKAKGRELARAHGVSPATITNIRRRKRWTALSEAV